MELALTGSFKEAAFFERHGVVNRLAEPGKALEEAIKLAETLLVNGPTALAASKEIVFQSLNWQDEEELGEADADRAAGPRLGRPSRRAESLCGKAEAGLEGPLTMSGARPGKPLPETILRRLRLPVIAAPMLRVSGPELVISGVPQWRRRGLPDSERPYCRGTRPMADPDRRLIGSC